MKRNLFFLLFPIFSGCVESIDMDPGEQELPVVVNCILTFDDSALHSSDFYIGGRCEKPTLTLQYAKGKSQREYVPVEDASVYLEGVFSHKPGLSEIPFTHKDGCNWEIEEEIGVLHYTTYTLKIKIPGKETIWAETTTPPVIQIEYAKGESGVAQSYKVDPSVAEGLSLWASGYIWDGQQSRKRLDYIATNHPYADDFNVCSKRFSDLSFQGEPTDECGRFYQGAFSKAQEMLSDVPLHQNILRIGNLENGEPFYCFAGPLCQPWNSPDMNAMFNHYSYIKFLFVNEDLDRYLRSVYVRNIALDSDLSHVYSTSNDIKSNINGALGIFGSCYCKQMPFIRTWNSFEN